GLRAAALRNIQHNAHRAIVARHAAAANETVRIGKLEAIAWLHAKHGAIEQYPCVERIDRKPLRDMIDRRQARVDSLHPRARPQVEIDFIKTVGSQLRRYEIDEASIRCTNGWDLELMRPDPAVEARTIERGRSVQR